MKLLRLELAVWIAWWNAPAYRPEIKKSDDFWILAAFVLCGELAYGLWITGAIRPLG